MQHEEPVNPSTLLTASGVYVDFLDPHASPLAIEDIAHGLAHCCRFAGQCREFYSVAQHSVLVARIVPPAHRLAALLHDASEAYLGDVTRPLKAFLGRYREIEDAMQSAILGRFGVADMPPTVKHADLVVLATERRDLMRAPAPDRRWPVLDGIEPLEARIVPESPDVARRRFLTLFNALTAEGRAS